MSGSHGFLNTLFILASLAVSVGLIYLPLYALDTANNFHETHHSFIHSSLSWSIDETPDEYFIDPTLISTMILTMFIAIGREIQIRIILLRANKYDGILKYINIFNAFLLIIGSINWILTIYIDVSENDFLHLITACIGWFCTLLHQFFNIILTLYQRIKCYNTDIYQNHSKNIIKRYYEIVLFILLWLFGTYSIVIFIGIKLNNNERILPNYINPFEPNEKHLYEWIAWWCMTSYYSILAIMFYRDPIDDELKEFFGDFFKNTKNCCYKCCKCCYPLCNCCSKNKNSKNNNNNDGFEMSDAERVRLQMEQSEQSDVANNKIEDV